MSIWIVETADDSFRGVLLSNRDEILQLPNLHGSRVGSNWPNLELRFSDGFVGNFVHFVAGLLACDQHTWSILEPHIADEVEAIPISVGESQLFALNVVNLIDCLDRDNSEIERFTSSGRLKRVTGYSFHTEMLSGALMFKLPEVPGYIYATEDFKTIVERQSLTGIYFRPLPTKNYN